MEVDATIRVPGAVYQISADSQASEHPVCVANDLSLYIHGRQVGRVLPGDSMRPDVERMYVMGQDAPAATIVHWTAIDCILEFDVMTECGECGRPIVSLQEVIDRG